MEHQRNNNNNLFLNDCMFFVFRQTVNLPVASLCFFIEWCLCVICCRHFHFQSRTLHESEHESRTTKRHGANGQPMVESEAWQPVWANIPVLHVWHQLLSTVGHPGNTASGNNSLGNQEQVWSEFFRSTNCQRKLWTKYVSGKMPLFFVCFLLLFLKTKRGSRPVWSFSMTMTRQFKQKSHE